MKAIEVISIPVADQERAKEFYTSKLGFAVIAEAPFGSDAKWIQLALPGADVSITLVNWFTAMPAGSLQGILIKVDDIEQEVNDLRAKGITIDKIDTTPWGKFAQFKDPDGNGWSYHEMQR